jgi:hypothetical protein
VPVRGVEVPATAAAAEVRHALRARFAATYPAHQSGGSATTPTDQSFLGHGIPLL